ncbi:MAG: hypothetical protein OCC49_01310 [Fibrobacterales bacterium]
MKISFLLPVSIVCTYAFIAFTSCELTESCACTSDIRFNYCVTINGKDSIPDFLDIIRISNLRTDTLSNTMDYSNNCFDEISGTTQVKIVKNNSIIAEKNDIVTKTVDCCHSEPIIVDFVLSDSLLFRD